MSIRQDIILLLSRADDMCVDEMVPKMPGYSQAKIRNNVNAIRRDGLARSYKNAGIAFYSLTKPGREALRQDRLSAESQETQRVRRLHPLESAWPVRGAA